MAAGAEGLASHLIGLAGRAGCPRGICAAPEGGALARELAGASEFVVIAQEPDDAAAQQARQAAYADGVGGRRLYVAVAPPDRLVPSERVVDLLVYAERTDATLPDRDEVLRVLCPELGRAVVGHRAGAPGALTRAALERWAAGLPAGIVDDPTGLWAVISQPALKGSDDWTHWFYDAGGNAVSKDTAFADPFQLAWTAKPYITSRLQTRAAAGGRLFNLFRRHQPEGMFQTHNFEGSNELVARNIHNGQILWRCPLADDEVYTQRSSLIATAAQVFLMRKGGVQVLDAATGAERRRIDFPGVEGRPKWMCLANGVLVTLIGPDDVPEFSPTANVMKTINRYKELTEAGGFGFGRDIIAVDAATGRQLWRHTEAVPVDGRIFGVNASGTVIGYALRSRVFALDLREGRQLWEQKTPEVLQAMEARTQSASWAWNAVSGPGLVCDDRVAAIAHAGSQTLVVLAVDDGRMLWTADRNVKWQPPIRTCLLPDRAIAIHSTAVSADVLTGKRVPSANVEKIASCGGFTATVRYGMGLSGPAVDLADGREIAPHLAKADCEVGNVVASGTFVQAPPACSVCNRVYGFLATRTFPAYDLRRPAADAERLVTPPGVRSPAPAGEPDPRDWSTYRANNRRSGSSPAGLPPAATVRWTWRPPRPLPPAGIEGHYALGAEHRATAPVAAGDRVYVAATDGSVAALSAADGRELWRHLAGGRVMSAPAVANGRVYAGCADGQVYCLNAATGELLWRFRVAPLERRTMIYGHLTSLWPVTGTPLVADGVVYAAAGQPMSVGGYVVALDSATGRLRWERSFVPVSGDEKLADPTARLKAPKEHLWISPWGQMALAGGVLHVRARSSTGIPGLMFDAATGEVRNAKLVDQNQPGSQGYGFMRGQDIGVLPDGRLVAGGMEPEYDQMAIGRLGRTVAVSAVADNAVNGKSGRSRMPAWNERLVVQPASGYAQGLAAMGLADWTAANAGAVKAKAAAESAAPEKDADAAASGGLLWGPLSPDGRPYANKYAARGTLVTALALASNGVAVVYPEGAVVEKARFGLAQPWKVACFALEDGRRVWEADLPGPAMLDGICIGGDGTTYVTLADGGVCAVGAK